MKSVVTEGNDATVRVRVPVQAGVAVMDHRREQRIPCRLDIELYRSGEYAGAARTVNVSYDGLCIETDVPLKRNELLEVAFPEELGAHGWPQRERAMVTHVTEGHAGLLFGEQVFSNLTMLEQVCRNTGPPDGGPGGAK